MTISQLPTIIQLWIEMFQQLGLPLQMAIQAAICFGVAVGIIKIAGG